MMDASVYELRIKELSPFASRTTVCKAIRNLEIQILEEATVKRLETELAGRILQTAKNNNELSKMEYVNRFITEYLTFEGFSKYSIPGHFYIKGFGNEIYLFSVEFNVVQGDSDAIFVTLKRVELKTQHNYRDKNKASRRFKRYPTFDSGNVKADENLVFKELKEARSVFKKTWKNLKLAKTPANSEKNEQ